MCFVCHDLRDCQRRCVTVGRWWHMRMAALGGFAAATMQDHISFKALIVCFYSADDGIPSSLSVHVAVLQSVTAKEAPNPLVINDSPCFGNFTFWLFLNWASKWLNMVMLCFLIFIAVLHTVTWSHLLGWSPLPKSSPLRFCFPLHTPFFPFLQTHPLA